MTATGSIESRRQGIATGARGVAEPWVLSQPTIHVIEDDDQAHVALLRLLRAQGFQARRYASATESLVAPRDASPSCILLDVVLPGLSGVDLQLALTRAGDEMPVVFLTG
jgi:FixJ family two-component response regulator